MLTLLSVSDWCRLAGNAWIADLARSDGSEPIGIHNKGWLCRTLNLPCYRMLLVSRTHSCFRRFPKLLHEEQRYLQLYWDPPPLRVPGLGPRSCHSVNRWIALMRRCFSFQFRQCGISHLCIHVWKQQLLPNSSLLLLLIHCAERN